MKYIDLMLPFFQKTLKAECVHLQKRLYEMEWKNKIAAGLEKNIQLTNNGLQQQKVQVYNEQRNCKLGASMPAHVPMIKLETTVSVSWHIFWIVLGFMYIHIQTNWCLNYYCSYMWTLKHTLCENSQDDPRSPLKQKIPKIVSEEDYVEMLDQFISLHETSHVTVNHFLNM